MVLILIFAFGLIVGSFLNAVIYRLKSGDSAFQGRSYCPSCKHTLLWQDLIPLVSFVLLRGKCRYCGNQISFQYPAVEIATGVIFLFIFNFQLSLLREDFGGQAIFNEFSNFLIFQTLYLFVVASLLIVLFVYDLRHYILPDKILFPAIGTVAVFRLFELNHGSLSENLASLAPPLAAGGSAAAFFFAIFALSKGRAMGFGDVKLTFFMGLFLGWPNILVALFTAFFLGSIIGVGLIFLQQKGWRSEIPFGPFLIIGTLVAFFWGKELVDFYINFLVI